MAQLKTYLEEWDPAPVIRADPLPVGPAHALAAVLGTPPQLVSDTELPPLWHWVYFLDWPAHSTLGPDGHPLEGRFLPPIPDRRRMFAGGRLQISRPLRLGEPAELTSSLGSVAVKQGRSGEMAFVTVRSEYRQQGRLRVAEEQDYVYRSGESAIKNARPERPQGMPASTSAWQQAFSADPVRLFRFSAVTANAHRIHYDEPYAREVESYPGPVVHGPMLVLLMTELARRSRTENTITTVDHQLRAPVFSGDSVLVSGDPEGKSARMAVLSGPETCNAEAAVGFA